MGRFEYHPFYRRCLPHIQPPDATLFITFRLAGSLPREVLERLAEERQRIQRIITNISDPIERHRRLDIEQRRWFGKWDALLDAAETGPTRLKNPLIASLVAESIHHRHGKVYDLEAFCIMPNHVHLVCKPLECGDGTFHSIATIMHSLKRYTAGEANRLLGQAGAFWLHESYDHYVRDEKELSRIITYVLNNPVKAGLIKHWQEWQWSYCKDT